MEQILNIILGIPIAFAQEAAATKGESPGAIAFILSNLPLWITAVIILVASLIIAFIVKKAVENRLAATVAEEHQEVLLLSGRVSFVTVTVLGVTIALAVAGIDLTSVIAALAFGISFGLQDLISNLVAGLGILATKPFTINDWIKVEGQIGKVENIRARTTFLKTYDGLRLIVPNATLFKANVISYTSNPLRRMKVPVYPRYECNMREVITICLNVVKANPRIYQEPKPSVVFIDYGDYYVELQVRFWVDAKGMWRRIQSEIMAEIQKRLEEAGLDSPYPVANVSFLEDGESYVLKTKPVDAGEYEKMKIERAQLSDELAKRRVELLKWQIAAEQAVPADTSGGAFLKTEANPSTDAISGAGSNTAIGPNPAPGSTYINPVPGANQSPPLVQQNFGGVAPSDTPAT
jgi:small conductance mechanosensitive channel